MIIKSLDIAERLVAAEGRSLITEHAMIFDLSKDTQYSTTVKDISNGTDLLRSWSLPIMQTTIYTRMSRS